MLVLEILLFFNFVLFAFALPFFAAAYYHIRPEKSFLPGLILNSMLFYLFAVFHISGIGFWVIYAANMLLYLPLVRKMRHRTPEEIAGELFTPGVPVLFAVLMLFFIFMRNEVCCAWDSVSHWMTSVKFFFDEEKLCCEYPAAVLSHASYPPGMCMMSMLVHKCFFCMPFKEGIVMMAHVLPIFGSAVWFFSRIRYRQTCGFFAALILFLALIPFMRHNLWYAYCYTDLCLGAVMAVTFYQTIILREYRTSDLVLLALLNSWMFMIRNAGWGYALGIMVFAGISLLIDRRKAFYTDGRSSGIKIAAASGIFILPVFMKVLWVFLLRYYSTALRFGGNKISMENFRTFFGSADAPGWGILKKFLGEISSFCLPFMLWTMIAALVLIRFAKDPVIRRGLRITVGFFVPATVLFLGVMFIYYCFEFEAGASFPSLDRYFMNFAIIPVLTVILLGLDALADLEKSTVVKRFWFYALYAAAAAVLIWMFLRLAVKKSDANLTFLAWRQECDQVRKYDSLFRAGSKFGHISTTGYGYKLFYMQYLYPWNYSKSVVEDPVLPGSKASEEREYSTPVTPEKLQENFTGVQYVYLIDPAEEFAEEFRTVFADGFVPDGKNIRNRLFKVTPEGKLLPVD